MNTPHTFPRRRNHNRRPEPGPDPPAPTGLELEPAAADVLIGLGPYYPATLGSSSSPCPGCGRESHAGDTVWWPDNHQHTKRPLCYDCGIALALDFAEPVAYARRLPSPYAGGLDAWEPPAP